MKNTNKKHVKQKKNAKQNKKSIQKRAKKLFFTSLVMIADHPLKYLKFYYLNRFQEKMFLNEEQLTFQNMPF